jgi:hypothetical protein
LNGEYNSVKNLDVKAGSGGASGGESGHGGHGLDENIDFSDVGFGDGGSGGSASLEVAGTLHVENDVEIKAGSGGEAFAVYVTSTGGAGGDVNFDVGTFSVEGTVVIEAGEGGDSITRDIIISTGGAGGDVNFNVGTFSAGETVDIKAGKGGTRDSDVANSLGGAGGDVILNVSTFSTQGAVNITAGEGGGAPIERSFSTGGASDASRVGGDVILTVADTFSAQSVTIESGTDGAGAVGGKVALSAKKLIAEAITLTKIDGELNVDVGTLDVNEEVELALNGTLAWDGTVGVRFNAIDLHGESTLKVTREDDGDYTFRNLNVLGKGATYDGDLTATNATFNFHLPQDIADGDTLLTVTGMIDDTNTIRLHSENNQPLSKLQTGESIILIETDDDLSAYPNLLGDRTLTAGFLDHLFTLSLSEDATDVEAMLMNLSTINPGTRTRAKPLSQGFLAGMAFLGQGADFLVGHGIPALLRAQPENAPNGLDLFAVLGGSRLRYKTGSHIDLSGETLIAGVTASRPTPAGRLTLGPFIEYGEGRFDTHNRFPNAERVRGSGEASYTGGGLLVHWKSNETDEGHFYTQASLHGGRIKLESDFDTPDLPGTHETRSTYGSGHLALGYVARLTDRIVFELYGQTLRSYQAADTVKLSAGEVKFDPVTSRRTRLGARWTHTLGPNTRLTLGAAWEREHDGKAKARFYIDDGNSLPIDAPKLKGDTGVFEAGFTMTPTRTSPWTVEIGVQGHVGQRQGVTGSIRVNYGF